MITGKNRLLTISLCLLLGLVSLYGAEPTTLHILYTQNNNGELENCQCPSNPLGGFEKRSTFLSEWMTNHPNTLLFDSGDFLSFDGSGESDLMVINLMEKMKYSAVNIGDQELSNGSLFFESYLSESHLPMVSSNLMVDSPKKKKFKRYKVLNIQGLKVAISGALGSEGLKYYTEADSESRIWSVEPEKALQILHDTQADVRDADINILLSNLGLDQDLDLINKIDFIDIILGGHSQHLLNEPLKKKNTVVVQCGKDGHYVGHLEIQIMDGKMMSYKHDAIPMGADIQDDQNIIEMIQEM